MAPLHNVAKLAWETFKTTSDKTSLYKKIKQVSDAMHLIRATDLNITEATHISKLAKSGRNVIRAPVGFMHIYEDNIMSMSVFFLKDGMSLPLHDHPRMYGLIKVVYGKVRIQAYTQTQLDSEKSKQLQSQEQYRSVLHRLTPSHLVTDAEFSEESQVCFLTPEEANMHQITACDGPAAFLDILSPPYDQSNDRDCSYFEELSKEVAPLIAGEESNLKWLKVIPAPRTYYCAELPYEGPDIDPSEIN